MRVIIGGAGRVGIALAKALANEKYDLVVVDNDSRAVANAQSLDCLVVNGILQKLLELVVAQGVWESWVRFDN